MYEVLFFPSQKMLTFEPAHNKAYILRMAEGFEKCSQNRGRVGYLPLEQLIKRSLLENESRYIILYNQALPKFYTRERSWRRGHSGKMYAHGDVFFVLFCFFLFNPHLFLLFLSLSSHFFCLF